MYKVYQRGIQMFNITKFLYKPVNELSLGQVQILNLARAFIPRPKLILYDEVFSSLDEENQNNLITFIEGISKGKQQHKLFVPITYNY